jgi:hypothetical protein
MRTIIAATLVILTTALAGCAPKEVSLLIDLIRAKALKVTRSRPGSANSSTRGRKLTVTA